MSGEPTVRRFVLEALQHGPLSPQELAAKFNTTHRKDAVVRGHESDKLTKAQMASTLSEMTSRGETVELTAPEGWVQLADWHDRPVRLLRVSNHGIHIAGAGDVDRYWVEESIRAARNEHQLNETYLQTFSGPGGESSVHISMANYETLEQYRSTLRRLADDLTMINRTKAQMYHQLAESTDIDDQFDVSEREVGLRV